MPHRNATTLQVACSVLAAALWMIENPNEGVCLPDQLPYEFILKHAKPYLGPYISEPVDWTPLKNWRHQFEHFGVRAAERRGCVAVQYVPGEQLSGRGV